MKYKLRWSIKIAHIAGIEVRIHITFLLFLAWIGFTYRRGQDVFRPAKVVINDLHADNSSSHAG